MSFNVTEVIEKSELWKFVKERARTPSPRTSAQHGHQKNDDANGGVV